MLLSALLGVLLGSGVATADTEILVRYREPQNTMAQAAKSALLSGAQHAQSLGLVSSEEGLVKLSFESPAAAQAAAEELLRSGRVESVAPNFYYSSALHLEFRDVEPEAIAEAFFAPLATLSGLAGGGIPDFVAPAPVKPGADPLTRKDWAMKNIRMPKKLDFTASRPMIAAVIDTGVDYTHEDLAGAMWHKPGRPQEVGYDFAHDVAKPYDKRQFDIEGCMKDKGCSAGIGTEHFLTNPGHGTHCAGHVGAVANNSLGMMGVGAPVGTQIMGLKFFYDSGEKGAGQGDDAAAIRSIDYAIKNGARIISASWGGRSTRAEGEKSELKKAFLRARAAGVLVVVAAGNDSIDQDGVEDPTFPAAYDLDNLIVVAATDSKDQLGKFSNYGRKSVHLGAPGVRILSTVPGGRYEDLVARYTDKEGKKREIAWDGTSMATPIVAGAAALVWSKFPTENYRQIKARLLRSVRKVPELSGKVVTGGVLDVTAALSAAAAL